ncbi:hypothetical protein [Actinomadura algeriensis]|uniref:Uncharacterized protein n=1 Tax=Actinomadura algeriensis TaxID=1679523 RepID=A0ABR9JUL1_9ACTN|nr:hypothetical protein [Actinomadura algeriensis]MBE1534245.1 hypothetical protein [Actinomadura algeriensis]
MSEVRITGAEGPDGLSLRTAGLSARGRPELAVSGLPPYLGHGWARVLGALAGHVASAPEVPAEVALAPDVVVRLERSGVRLVPVPSDPALDVDEWRRDIVVRLFPEAGA